MRGLAIAVLMAGALLAPAAAGAAPAAQVPPSDFVKAIQDSAPAHSPDSSPALSSDCPAGYGLNEDGICQRLITKRGFSLATSDSGSRPAQRADAAPHRAASAPMAPVRVAAHAPARSSRLSDLLITFKLGSAQLTEQGQANARSFAEALQNPAVRDTHFEIAGHTDASGAPARNIELSQARAEAVKDFLVSQGVDATRLEAKGYGSSELARPNEPRSPANRRVEARLVS